MMGGPMDKDNQPLFTEDEEEISLVELMVQLLSGWKKILLLAVLFAVLLGGYRAASGLWTRADKESAAEAEEKYQTALRSYTFQKELLEDQIESANESIQQNTDYKDSSVLMQLNPYDYMAASVVYFIDAHYTVDPNTVVQSLDPTRSLVRAYEAKLQTADFYQYVAETPALQGQLDSSSLQELISVQAEQDTRMLTINIVSVDRSQAEAIVDAVQQYVEALQGRIAEKIAAHDLQLLSASSYQMKNGSTTDGGNSGEGAALNAMGNAVAAKQQDYENTVRDLNQRLEDLQTQQSELEEPALDDIGHGLKKATVKFALIGLVLGAFLGCGWITLVMLLGDSFCDEEELQQRYGLTLLGSLRRFPEKGIMNCICAALSGDQGRQTDLTSLADFAQSNVAACLRRKQMDAENTPVLLAGSDDEKLAALGAALTKKSGTDGYQLCGDILRDPAAVAMLQPGARVVICEEKGSAKRQTIVNEVRKLSGLGCDVLGIISL